MNATAKTRMAMCRNCRHDLETAANAALGNGHVHCSNPACEFATKPHPMSNGLND